MLAPGNEKTKDRTELNENSSNDIQASRILGAQPEGKKNDRKKPHCEAAEQIADSLMEEVSLFVEENTEAEIIDEEREIR